MNRIWAALILAAAAATPAGAQDDPVKALQKRVQEVSRKVSSAFVFFPGGSGVFISEDGWCLTNHHVIAPPAVMRGVEIPTPTAYTVTLQDAKRRQAELTCSDAVGDIALLKLEPAAGEKFPFLALADSDKCEVGQYVLAIGAPFSIGAQGDPAPDGRHYPSVSLGIISALHRYQAQYGDCIQTDAAVNPGNSGGPLVDLDGRLVGINGRILTRYMNRTNSGVGFAIPSNQIRNFLPKMKEGGANRRIFHGSVSGVYLYDFADERGEVLVRDVTANTPAADRGLRRGDTLLEVNGQKVFNRRRFLGIVSTWPADTEVTLKVRREEKTFDIKVPLEAVEELSITGAPVKPPPKAKGSTGATFEDEKPGSDGPVTVTFVTPLSPADTAGLMTGDVVTQVDGQNVKNRKTIVDRIQSRKPGDTVTLRVQREGEEFDVKVKLGQLSRTEE